MSDLYDTNPGEPRVPLRATADGALRVAVVSGGGGGGGGSGTSDTTESTQLLVKTAVQNIDADLGAPADAAAGSDTGSFSLIALVKRMLQRVTTIIDRQPDLVSGRVPVDGSGVTQPVSASSLPLPTGAATETTLAAVSGKLPGSLGGKAAAASLSVTTATGSITSIGGTVAAGGTAQQLAAANPARRGITLQNTSSAELRVNPFGAAASASAGYRVLAGELLVLDAPHCGVAAVSIWGATTGQAFIGGEAV